MSSAVLRNLCLLGLSALLALLSNVFERQPFFSAAHHAPKARLVFNDQGGFVSDYERRLLRYQTHHTLLRIGGTCYSACTFYLRLPPEQLCLTSPATAFWFHHSYVAKDNGVNDYTSPDTEVEEEREIQLYPLWVQRWLRSQLLQHAFTVEDGATLTGPLLLAHIRLCDAPPSTPEPALSFAPW